MSSRRDRDDDLADLLSELRTTLDRLDRELQDESRVRERGRSRVRPRPPSASEFLRFTDEYTIPTVISLLEATIRSLELLQGVLRLVDPDRSARLGRGDDGPRLPAPTDAARNDVAESARRALSELRTALSEADLPEEPESRDIVADARRLSAEIERRIDESERAERRREAVRDDVPRRGRGERGDGTDGSVRIGVSEEGENEDGGGAPDGTGRDDADERASSRPGDAVDVEAELRSIKEEMGAPPDDPSDGGDEDVGEPDDRD